MDRFIAPEQRWADPSLLHVYLLPQRELEVDLAVLVDRCRSVVAEFPSVAPVPAQRLYVTVQMITARPGTRAGPKRDRLVERLRATVAMVSPAGRRVGSVLAGASGVVADADGDLARRAVAHDLPARAGQRSVRFSAGTLTCDA